MCKFTEKLFEKGYAKGKQAASKLNMSKLTEEVFAKGFAEGYVEVITNKKLFIIRNMMKSLNLTTSEAMDVLEIPTEERSFYLEKLEETK